MPMWANTGDRWFSDLCVPLLGPTLITSGLRIQEASVGYRFVSLLVCVHIGGKVRGAHPEPLHHPL